MSWEWNEDTKEYDGQDGDRDLDALALIGLRNDYVERTELIYTASPKDGDEEEDYSLTALYILGLISLAEFEKGMRDAIQTVVVGQWALSKGGMDQLTDEDREQIEAYLLVQYGFLSAFVLSISLGRLSDAQIYNRAALYFSDTTQAYERGRSTAYDTNLILPAHPGDCSSECCARDLCYIMYNETDIEIFVSWNRTSAESCPTCLRRAACPELVFDKASGILTGGECW